MVKLTLGQFMTHGVETLPPDAFIMELIGRMRTCRVSCVVVTDRGRPVGIVSERDCVAWLQETVEGRDMTRVKVSEVMTSPVVTVTRDTTWLDALDMVRRRKVRRLPVVDDAGLLVGLVTQTDLLNAQRMAFQSHHQELEVSVAERTRELAQARDEAEALLQANLRFLATMTHEIRTPMGGVVSVAELLRDTTLTSQQEDWVGTIIGTGRSLMTLVNDILDYTQMESSSVELERIPFDLLDVVEDVADLSALKAQGKGVAFRVVYDPTLPHQLMGDPGRLRQVLTNLCGNAVKFTDHGEVAVHLSGRVGDRGRARLRIEVRDSGVGIDQERQKQLFQAYAQADASIRRRYGGTGLGLAITKQLVDAMGGDIGVTSTPDVGSTFWFEMDLEVTAHSHRPPTSVGQALIVDPSPATATDLRQMLAALGVRARAFDRVDRAHAVVTAGERFDAAFVRFPLADRGENRRLESLLNALGEAPVYLVTDIADHAPAASMTSQGFAGALTRPFKRRPLRDALLHTLAVPDRPMAAHSLRPKAARVARQNTRILLADDNAVNQMVLEHQLRKAGYDCVVVGNGKEALRSFRERRWDLVLMDCHMPVMDGIAATHAMRAFEREHDLERTKIIALSASNAREEREDCLAAGMDAFLTKPLDSEIIERTIDDHLSIGKGFQLTPMQRDALTELMNIGVGLAASNLSAMVGMPVVLSVPSVSTGTDQNLHATMSTFEADDWLSVDLGFFGALGGRSALMLPEQSARSLVAAIDPDHSGPLSSAQHREQIVIEIGNILLNSLVGSFSNVLDKGVDFEVPCFVRGRLARLLASEEYFGKAKLLLAQTHVRVQDLDVSALVVVLLSLQSFEELLSMVDRFGEPVPLTQAS